MTRTSDGRITAIVTVSTLLLAACGGGSRTGDDRAGAVVQDAVEAGEREDVPSALDQIDDPALPDPLVDPAEVTSGGPPPDGIPAIDEPKFEQASEVDWIADDEPVLALEIDGEQRAYPVQVLIWHEIVNDTLAGVPVSVTYCPLCNSALAFDRRVGDRLLTFGTSGLLYLSALVMYDRQTESLWSQIESRSIAGVLAGKTLDTIPVQTVAWEQWRSQFPAGSVLSRDTGHTRDYGSNPYAGYDNPDGTPFLFSGEPDPRLEPMTRVLGVERGGESVAVVLEELTSIGVTRLTVGDEPLTAWAVPGLASPLDAGTVADGYSVGATGVFDPRVDDRELTFEPTDAGRFRDTETGSTWSLTGQAVDGRLKGEQLRTVSHLDTFWFAWAASQPDTTIVEAR